MMDGVGTSYCHQSIRHPSQMDGAARVGSLFLRQDTRSSVVLPQLADWLWGQRSPGLPCVAKSSLPEQSGSRRQQNIGVGMLALMDYVILFDLSKSRHDVLMYTDVYSIHTEL